MRRPAHPFRTGYVFGLVFWVGQMYWLWEFVGKWLDNRWLAALPWLASAAILALWSGLFGWAFGRGRGVGPGLFALGWAGLELLRSMAPVVAFPWGLLGAPLIHSEWLRQPAAWVTVYGTSAMVAAVAALLAAWWVHGLHGGMSPAAIGVGLYVAMGLVRMPAPNLPLAVAAAQTGFDMAYGDPSEEPEKLRRVAPVLTENAAAEATALIVFPEGLLQSRSADEPRVPFETRGMAVLIGGQSGDTQRFQTAFGTDRDGSRRVYDKTRLVIFGEFVPARDWLPFLKEFSLPEGDLSPSPRGVHPLTLAGVQVSPLICFEALFPDVVWTQRMKGGQVLALMSNEDWFHGTNALDRLREASLWRAVEVGLPLVRAASLGDSLLATHRGTVTGLAPRGQAAVVAGTVQVPEPGSARPWWLPLFPAAALVTFIAAVARGIGRP